MHHAIWVEHDGSWTWSIEEGKAFEDGHRVLARNDGYPTRGDAKDAMQKEWRRLMDAGKTPGRLGKTAATKNAARAAGAANASDAVTIADTMPDWAVIGDGCVVALFRDAKAAKAYAKSQGLGDATVAQVQLGLALR